MQRPRGAPVAIGVDGCRAGWVAATLHADGATSLALWADADGGLGALVAAVEAACGDGPRPVVAVDVPMGLPAHAGFRACDREARALLGARASSVFPAPDRALLGRTFEEAREIVHARRAADPDGTHPVMTHQAMNIAPKVAEADALLLADPRRQEWVVEAHPELLFHVLAGDEGPLPPKRAAEGRARRVDLVAGAFPDAPGVIDAATWPRALVAADDVLDAYAALWGARRLATGDPAARMLGGERDPEGLVMRILA